MCMYVYVCIYICMYIYIFLNIVDSIYLGTVLLVLKMGFFFSSLKKNTHQILVICINDIITIE